MSTNLRTIPKFSKDEMVRFAGGMGTIRNYHFNANTWVYVIEMEMGPEPDYGRVGSETTILLQETDLQEH